MKFNVVYYIVGFGMTMLTANGAAVTLYGVEEPYTSETGFAVEPVPTGAVANISAIGVSTFADGGVETTYVEVVTVSETIELVLTDGSTTTPTVTEVLTATFAQNVSAAHWTQTRKGSIGSDIGSCVFNTTDNTGSCKDVIVGQGASSPVTVFTLSATGKLAPVYTITSTQPVPTSTQTSTQTSNNSKLRVNTRGVIWIGLFMISFGYIL